jgi:hypothetical protein
MRAFWGTRRRHNKAATHSFKPSLDLLEDRVTPSAQLWLDGPTGIATPIPIATVLNGVSLPPISVPPISLPPVSIGQGSVLTVSTQQLEVTRGGSAATFTIVLNSEPTAEVDVTLASYAGLTYFAQNVGDSTSDLGNTITITPPHLAFTADNWSKPQTVSVSAPATTSPQGETWVSIFGTTTSADPNFDAQAVPPISVDVSDPVPAGVVLSTHWLYVTRGGNGDSVAIALATQPTDTVTITVAQSDGDALQIAPAKLTFTPDNWSTAQTVSVGPPTGGTGKQLDTLTLTDSSNDPSYNNGALPSLTVYVAGPVATGQLVLSTQSLQLTAGGPSASYTIALASQPTANVTVTIDQMGGVPDPVIGPYGPITPGGGLSLTPQTLTFTPDDWNQPQTVTVAAPAGWTGTFPFVSLTDTVTSDDPNYDGITPPPVTVEVTANSAGIVLSTDELDLARGGAAATYTIALATQPTANVTITIAQTSPIVSPVGLAGTVGSAGPKVDDPLQISPTSLTFTPDDWDQPQTVKVGPPASGSGDQFDILTHTATSDDPSYRGLNLPGVRVHVSDPAAGQAGVVVSTQSLSVTAGGPSVTYTIALASQPSADVTVAINQFSPVLDPPMKLAGAMPIFGGAGTTLTITPQTVTFTKDNWNQPVTITVSAPAGQVGPFGGFVILDDTVTSDDSSYNNLPAPSVAVRVENNPAYSLVFSTNHLELAPGASGTYTIALASQPTDTVTVTIAQQHAWPGPIPLPAIAINGGGPKFVDTSNLTIAPTTLTFTPDNWNTPQTVTLTTEPANADASWVIEFDHLAHTVTSNDANWNNIAAPPVFVVVSSFAIPIDPITELPPILGIGIGIDPTPITPPGTGNTGVKNPDGSSPNNGAANTIMQTQTALTLSSSSAPFGQTVTLTAKVTTKGHNKTTPTGTVTFMDGTTVLGTGTLSKGIATLQTASLDVGNHMLTAVFAGDTSTESASTSAVRTETISKARTRVALTVSAAPAVFGQLITLTATVTVTAGTAAPTGIVTFKDGSTVLGTGTLDHGVATLQTASLAVGEHHLKAVYAGDADTASSTAHVTDTVKKAITATTLAASPTNSTVALGTPITLTATVSVASPGAATLTGIVTFRDGSKVLGTGTINAGIATLQTSQLAKGKHRLTAIYAGDGDTTKSKSVTLTITIE